MKYQFSNFSPSQFLQEYWQKKPVLIKAAFNSFDDPIDADELAGLACEAEIESRIIIKQDDKWHVEHGPFESFAHLSEQDWTLLVQAVDHISVETAELIEPFRFIPNWRIDDVMVSFSMPGGGVGAHVDQYDVFILQGQGKRHWKVGLPQTLTDKIPHPDLLQVTGFDAIIDAVLEPGDLLYIPPGCPHEGYAVEPALNYSIGFRAPDQQDLLSSFADYALQEECFKQRYADPSLTIRDDNSQVNADEIAQLKQLILSTVSDKSHFNNWLGGYLTQAKHELAIEPVTPAYQSEELLEILQQVTHWHKLGGLRCLFIEDNLFINGEAVSLNLAQHSFAKYLAQNQQYTSQQLSEFVQNVDNLQLLLALVNEGLIFVEDDSEF